MKPALQVPRNAQRGPRIACVQRVILPEEGDENLVRIGCGLVPGARW